MTSASDGARSEQPVQAAPSVLVVEDDPLIAMDLADFLSAEGFAVLGPVSNVMKAIEMISLQRPKAVVLDLDLRGENATPVAVVLRAEAIPFLLTTGNSVRKSSETSGPLAGVINLGKPTPLDELLQHLKQMLTPSSA